MRKLLRKRANLYFVFLFCLSCNFNSEYINEEEAKKDAEFFLNTFYENISRDESLDITEYFHIDFFKKTRKDFFLKMFSETKVKLGKYKKKKLLDWQTSRKEGEVCFTMYQLKYEVEYENDIAIETFKLIKEEGKEIKILGYNVNSEVFMK